MNKIKVAKNFYLNEFESESDKVVKIDSELLSCLQKFREYTNKPCKINSGFRTQNDTKRLLSQGLKTNYKSQHNKGKAVDISIKNWNLSKSELKKIAIKSGFKGIGINMGSFIHLDVRENYNKRGYSYWEY